MSLFYSIRVNPIQKRIRLTPNHLSIDLAKIFQMSVLILLVSNRPDLVLISLSGYPFEVLFQKN